MNGEINKLTKKTKQRLTIAAIIVAAMLLIFISLISLLMIYQHNLRREKQKAMEFLEQMIESMNKQTDFYKKRTYARDIREIEIYKDKLSDDYEIKLTDHDPGYYKYSITFDHKYSFYVTVTADENNFILSHFCPAEQFY